MTVYIVERSLPGLGEQHRVSMQEALTEASRRLSASGSPVNYLGSTFVPQRARCFCMFEADSEAVVRAANEAALVPFLTINEAIELPVPKRAPNARRRRDRRQPARL